MNRRNFLIGAGASVIALSSGAQAAKILEIPKVPISESAIFNLPQMVKEGEILGYDPATTPHLWYRMQKVILPPEEELDSIPMFFQENDGASIATNTTKLPQMGFRILKFSSEDETGIRFDDGRDVDQYYISNCLYFKQSNFDTENMDFEDRAVRFALTSAGNSIAKETRMGAGNHIVLHPTKAKIARELGYTTHRPFQNMIERDWMPRNEVFVFYRGNSQYDNPGLLFHNGNLVLPDGFSYGRRVKFKA